MKITRRTKLLVVALALCFTTMIGSTFAWFTDSAESAVNTIEAGNLDMVVEYKTSANGEWATLTESTKLFKEDALYEPGYTEIVFLRVANAGNLAFKYNLAVSVEDTAIGKSVLGNDIKLSNYLNMGIYTESEFNDTHNYADILLPVMFSTRASALSNVKKTVELKSMDTNGLVTLDSDRPVVTGNYGSQVAALVLTMPTTVGNEANHDGTTVPKINLGVHIVATQAVSESDSFGNEDGYDADATYPDLSEVELDAWENLDIVNGDVTRENQLAEEYVEIAHTSGNLTLKNVTFKNGLTIYTNEQNNSGTVTLEECVIYLNNGQGDPAHPTKTQYRADHGLNLNLVNGSDITFKFIDCIFTVADGHNYTNTSNSYNVYIGGGYSADHITFTGCDFEGSGKHGIGCSSEGTSQYYTLTVSGCNFKNWNNNATFTNGAAIRGNLPSADFNAQITISGNTFGNNNGSTQTTVAIDSWTGSWN